MSPDGYITITGRIKDLIIRGGENIHPLEVENCLLAQPGVADVSIVGVPDERYGEAVAAFVILRENNARTVTAEDIQEWVRGKLSSHLGKSFPRSITACLLIVPSIVPKHVFFRESSIPFPKTASGKIQKFRLREDALKLLHTEPGATGSV